MLLLNVIAVSVAMMWGRKFTITNNSHIFSLIQSLNDVGLHVRWPCWCYIGLYYAPAPYGGSGALSGDRRPSSVRPSVRLSVCLMSRTSALTRKPKGLGRRNFAQYPRSHATPTPTSRSKGQKSRWGGGILWRRPSRTACWNINHDVYSLQSFDSDPEPLDFNLDFMRHKFHNDVASPLDQAANFHPNRTILGGVLTLYRFSSWRPLPRCNFTAGFG